MIQYINKAIFTSFIYAISCTLVFAQTAALLPNALQQYFDNNGNPLSSGTVGFYYPSTLNLKPIFQDSGEVTLWTNPITLDAGGKPPGGSGGIYGQGTYRQIVKDASGNLIWDAVTSSAGTAGGTPSTGDGQLVGSIKAWAGILAPNQYLFAYGQQISRTTYAALYNAITQIANVTCTNSSNTLSGIADTTQINIGAPLEVTCMPAGTTVSSKTSSTVVASNASTVNLNTTAVFFPFGNGDGSTTFTLPDLRGNVIAGRPNMGGTASTNLTNAYCANATAQGAVCGAQSQTLVTANLPNNTYTPIFTGTLQTWNLNAAVPTGLIVNGATPGGATVGGGTTTPSTNVTPSGTINAYNLNGNVTQTAFSKIQPTLVLNYIIKVLPDSNSAIASGVTSLGLMTGDIACGNGLLCTGNNISVIGGAGGTAGGANTNVQYNNGGLFAGSANLTFVGSTLTIGSTGAATGSLVIGASGTGSLTQTVQTNAGSPTVTWGTSSGTPAVTATSPLAITATTGAISCATCSNNAAPLSQFASTTSSQLYGVMSDPTGTAGQLVFSNTPTLTTPVLGAATATSINGLTITSSTGTLTIANAKTATVNNSLTLAGTDATTITFQGTDTYVGRATTDTLTNKTFDTAGTGNAFKIAGSSITSIAGNTAIVGTVSGSLISGNCLRSDANHNIVDAGGACTTGGGGGTVSSGTSGQLTYYGSTGTTVSGNPNFTVSTGTLTAGIAGSVQGNIAIAGVTSGATTLTTAAAASGTLTLPAATDTLVGRATTDTLTNKTLTAPVIATISNSGTLTLPTGANTIVARATTDTFTNKTLDTAGTGNVFKINGTTISSISGNTAKVVTATGAYTNGDCGSFDASGNLADNGSACYVAPTFIFYPSCTAGGSVDCAANINTALASCVSSTGGKIILPPGLIRVSAVVWPSNSGGCEMTGAGTYQEYNGTFGSQTQPTQGTILYQTASDVLTCAILIGGNSGINHAYMHDISFAQAQPADGAIHATGTGSGTALTVSSVTGTIAIGQGVADTTNPAKVPLGTVIVSGSGSSWVTNQATTPSGDTLTFFAPTVYKPSICGASQAEIDRVFFWNVYTGIQIGTSASGVTNNSTAAGNATLHLTANYLVPNLIGAVVTNITHPTVIPANTTILAEPSSTTLTMSANATGAGVANGDTLQFSMSTGRTTIHHISGECFFACVDHEFSADFTQLDDTECFEPGASQPTMNNFIQAISNCVLFGRADQPSVNNIKSFQQLSAVGFRAVPDGAVSWGQFSGVQCDGCVFGVNISQCTQASFSNVHVNGATSKDALGNSSIGINAGGNSCTQSPGVSPSTSAPYAGGTNIVSFSTVDIQGPTSYCIAANVIDMSLTNLHCQNFNGSVGAVVGIIMNAGATYTASGRQALNNSGTNGTTSGTVHGTVPF